MSAPYIRNTLAADKNSGARGRADRHLPGHAPGRAADARRPPRRCSNGLFFDSERYDLSAVGRVKMNARLGLETEDTVRVLRKEDILAVVKVLVDLKDGRARSTTSTISATGACARSAS